MGRSWAERRVATVLAAFGWMAASVGPTAVVTTGCMNMDAQELPACPVSEAPPSGLHRLYLDFDGEAIVPGADDATRSRSHLVGAEVTVPPFSGEPADVRAIVASVRATLAPYDVEVVSTRPVDGVYDMLVFGGRSDRIVGVEGVQFAGPDACDAWPESQLAFVFDVRKPQEAFASTAIGLYAVMHGAATTATPGDCLCLSDDACAASPLRCTLRSRVLGSTTSSCRSAAALSSDQEMADAFGCRL